MKIFKNNSHGFTLVELLAVIGIIILMMSILISSIFTGREKANQARCSSNMRQLLIGLAIYEQERKVFPAAANNGQLITMLYPSYVDNYDVFTCPSFRNTSGEARGPVSGHYTHFDYNTSHTISGSPADNTAFSLSNSVLLIDTIWGSTTPRHSKGNNLGFGDGHVEWYSKNACNSAEPGFSSNVGWQQWGER